MQVTVELRRQSVRHQPPRFAPRFRVIILPCYVHYPSIIREIPSDPVPSAGSIDPLLCLHFETMSLQWKYTTRNGLFSHFYFTDWKSMIQRFPEERIVFHLDIWNRILFRSASNYRRIKFKANYWNVIFNMDGQRFRCAPNKLSKKLIGRLFETFGSGLLWLDKASLRIGFFINRYRKPCNINTAYFRGSLFISFVATVSERRIL